MLHRLHRLCITFLAKKYVAWMVANWFLYTDKVTGTDWVMMTIGVFCIDAYSKTKLLPGTISRDNPME